jgi:hypothetical protein
LLGIFEFLKISLSDLIETLGLVLSRPWKMASAVYTGGNSLENALLYYFFLVSAATLIAFFPLDLGAGFRQYAQVALIANFLVLAVTSVTLLWGLRICGVAISYSKALTIRAFIGGAYTLIVAIGLALATSLITILLPDQKMTFTAMTLGCIPIFDFSSGVPVIVAPRFGFTVHVVVSLVSFALSTFLFFGAFYGLSSFRRVHGALFFSTAVILFVVDNLLWASFAGMFMNDGSAFCIAARESLAQ